MLQEHLTTLSQELSLEIPLVLNDKKECTLSFSDFSIQIKNLDPGLFLYSPICNVPQKKRETIFIKLMEANLLGQGTGGSVIGMDKEEKFLTLSLKIAYELNYQTIKESIEDFINYLMYWKEEVEKLVTEELL